MPRAGSASYTAQVNIPVGMQVAFQGKAASMREIAQQLSSAGIATTSGPLPGGG